MRFVCENLPTITISVILSAIEKNTQHSNMKQLILAIMIIQSSTVFAETHQNNTIIPTTSAYNKTTNPEPNVTKLKHSTEIKPALTKNDYMVRKKQMLKSEVNLMMIIIYRKAMIQIW